MSINLFLQGLTNGPFSEISIEDYDLFKCEGSEQDRKCTFQSDGLMDYAADNGFFSIINFIAFALIILFLLAYAIFSLIRCCCRCCCHNDDPIDLQPKKRNPWNILCRVLAVVSVLLVFFLSIFMGSHALVESSYGVVNAPAGIKKIATALEPKVTEVFIDTASEVFSPALKSLNVTINDAINVPLLAENMQIINVSVPRLPDIPLVVDRLRNIENITTRNSTTALIDELKSILDGLATDQDRLDEIVWSLGNVTQDMRTANTELSDEIGVTNATLNQMSVLLVDMVGTDSQDGTVDDIVSDLTAIQRAPDGMLPSTAEFSSTSDGSYGTTPRLVSGAMTGDAAEIEAMTANLTMIYSNISGLPNYTETAQQIALLNQTLESMLSSNGILSNLTSSLDRMSDLVTNYPGLGVASASLTEIDGMMGGVGDDLNRSVLILESLDDAFSQIPADLGDIKYQIEQIHLLGDILDALHSITDQLTGINDTLVKLPNGLETISEAFDDLNSTFVDVLKDVDKMTADIESANSTIFGYLADGREYTAKIKDAEGDITQTLDDFDLSSINNTINAAVDSLTSVDFSATLSNVDTFRTTLEGISLDSDLTDALTTFQSGINVLVASLRRGVDPTAGGPDGTAAGDYILLSAGYCTSSTTTSCSQDSDCSGTGPCIGYGTYRCAADGSQACSDDSDCAGSSSYCLADSDIATALNAQLVAFSSSASDVDVSGYLSDLSSIEANSDLDLSAAQDALANADTAITSVNLTEVDVLLRDLSDGLNTFDASSATGDLDYDIGDIGIQDVIDLVEPIEADMEDLIDEYHPLIEDYTSTMIALREFLFDKENLRAILGNMTQAHLSSLHVSRGPNAMVKSLVGLIDSANNFFHDNQDGIKVSSSDLEGDVDDDFEYLDRMGAYEVSGFGDMRRNGATYYLFRLFNESTVLADFPFLMGIYANTDNERYENGDTCLIEDCEEHTLDVVHYSPMSEWHLEFPQMDMPMLDDIDYSTQDIFLMLWIFPLILVFVGVITLLLVKVGNSTMEKCCDGCFMALVYCQLPFVFLFTGLFLYFAIVSNGVCDEWTVVGRMYITGFGDDFCHEVLGGNGTLRACTFDEDLGKAAGGGNISVSVDVLKWYGGIFEERCGGEDPFAELLQSLSDQVESIPREAIDEYLEDNDLDLRDPVKDILTDAADNTGTVLHNFLYGLSEDVLSCSKVSSIIADINEETCVSYTSPFLWIMWPWYAYGWILLCFGCIPNFCVKKMKKGKGGVMTISPEYIEQQPEGGFVMQRPDTLPVNIVLHNIGKEDNAVFVNDSFENRDMFDMFKLEVQAPEAMDVSIRYCAMCEGQEVQSGEVREGEFCGLGKGTPVIRFYAYLEGSHASNYNLKYITQVVDGSESGWLEKRDMAPTAKNEMPITGIRMFIKRREGAWTSDFDEEQGSGRDGFSMGSNKVAPDPSPTPVENPHPLYMDSEPIEAEFEPTSPKPGSIQMESVGSRDNED